MVARCEVTLTVLSKGESVETKLHRIAEKARKEPLVKFNNLYTLLNEELLRGCFNQLRNDAAAGIDNETKEMYAANLDANLSDLVDRLHGMSYIPQSVRRVYIPKAGSAKQRPLGIPCFEDKLVQSGMVRILNAVYEQDFIEESYGFRPGRNCHKALIELSDTVEKKLVSYIVEADIKGFFDNVSQKLLLEFLKHRIADKRLLRMVVRFLKAGVLEDGIVTISDKGTPQGGVISPLLANIYLHYTLDLWFTNGYRKSCRGYAHIIRYADDFVVCFQLKADAELFLIELKSRLSKFNLEVEPTKTRIIEFGRFAVANATKSGKRAETLDFLGFTHYCGTSKDGKRFRVKRLTARKKFIAKLHAFKEWLKKSRRMKTSELWETVKLKLLGHFGYYGVTDNFSGINNFSQQVRKLLFKWLNRRGKRGCINCEKFSGMLKRFPLPNPRIMVSMFKTVRTTI